MDSETDSSSSDQNHSSSSCDMVGLISNDREQDTTAIKVGATDSSNTMFLVLRLTDLRSVIVT